MTLTCATCGLLFVEHDVRAPNACRNCAVEAPFKRWSKPLELGPVWIAWISAISAARLERVKITTLR